MHMAEQIYMAVRHAETCGGIMRRLSPDDANLLREHLVQCLCRHNKEEGGYAGVVVLCKGQDTLSSAFAVTTRKKEATLESLFFAKDRISFWANV